MYKTSNCSNKMKEAVYYKKIGEKNVQCILCPHFCFLKENETGRCRVRKNIKGILYSLSYEQPVAINLDPIEKKPLYNFLPGTIAFSIGMAGCNSRCLHCQNWEMSQRGPEEIPAPKVSAKEIMREALKSKCPTISYTYSEPLVSYEYVLDIAKLAKKVGLKNTIVSNGFINPAPLKELCKYIDGANIDLKSISDKFYREICGVRVSPVLEALKILKWGGVWIEIANLIIPTLNDKEEDIKNLVKWVKENLGTKVPLHFTAFYPCYKLSHLPSTPLETLKKARKIALQEGLKYVYTGNIQDEDGESTFCPKCGKLVIKRRLFSVIENNLKNGKCKYCNREIDGFWGIKN